ncbi:MAG: TonB-dependent siderophore receptor [Gammaproteobacteria bacterium]|nr:TonB-dependent siderophore receptor [Gammaproteobacteria bacterium]MBQ0774647.1 TonB-dependent siderophore receptor [Gammaproteobacteria bacterium]
MSRSYSARSSMSLPQRRVLASAISVALATGAGLARAETQDGGAVESAAVLPTISVEGTQAESFKAEKASNPQYTAPLLDTPQTIHVVPAAVIEEREATTLRDVLRNVPGISMQAGEGGAPPGDQMSIRGFSARTDIFIDGVRDFGGYSRDPFNLEQVEVVKGPSGSYTGRGSTGGSVNLVSKAPRLEDSLEGSLGAGTDKYQRTTLDINKAVGDTTAVRFNLMQHEQDVAGRDEVFSQRSGIAPSIAFGVGTDTRLTLSYFHMTQDNMPDYGIPWVPEANTALPGSQNQPAPVDYDNFYGLTARDYEHIQNDLATIQFEKDVTDSVTLRNITRYGRTHRDFVATAPRFVSNTSTDIRRSDDKNRDQVDEVMTNMTDASFAFTTGDIAHALVTGFEFTREFETNRLRSPSGPDSPDTDLYNPTPSDPYTEALIYTGEKRESTAKTTAVFIGDTLDLSEQWQVNVGARFDHFKVKYRADETLRQTDDMFSWRAGAVYKPAQNGSIYVGYGVSLNPSAEGMSLSDATGSRPGTFGLDPQENRTVELGTKWELAGDRLLVNAAVFRTDKTNAVTQDPADPNDINVLEGEQRVEGLELGATGDITDAWQVYAGYTWMTSEVLSSKSAAEVGKEVSNTPENTLSAWTSYQLTPAVSVGAGAQYVDTRYSNNSNTRQAPDYWVYDAMATWALDDTFTVRLNLKNLTDEDYIDQVGGGHVVPGEGRLAVASLDFKF